MDERITIVGAGLAGSLLAVYIARKGFAVDIYERRSDMRNAQIGAGKSINLALSTRGIYALEEVGLFGELQKIAIPMQGRMMHSPDGELTFQRYGRQKHEVIRSVSRAELNCRLMDLAEREPGVRIHFDQRCLDASFSRNEITFCDENTNAYNTVEFSRLIATDGAHSAIRTAMQRATRMDYRQFYLEHGYKELTIPPRNDGEFQLEPHALHIWPRGSYMMIALPNLDRSFTCTLFLPFAGKYGFDELDDEAKVRNFFAEQFPDAVPLLENLVEEYFANPTGSLITVKCYPWVIGDSVAILGDAAHAIVPFFGQGMNCAFEDCTVFNQCIEAAPGNWHEIFSNYQKLRKDNADAIADMALENFIEMRDDVRDSKFLLKKKVGLLLEEKFSERFIPRYSMVTFHRIPYREALEKGRIQEHILDELCADIDDPNEVSLEKAQILIEQRLE